MDHLALLLALIFMLVFLGQELVTYLLRLRSTGYSQWLHLNVAGANGATRVPVAVMASTRHMHGFCEITVPPVGWIWGTRGPCVRISINLGLAF